MKNLIILFCLISSISHAQIQSVDYLLKFDNTKKQYDVFLVVVEGETNIVSHRSQYNSQISIVVPTGNELIITDRFMPLQGNQNFLGGPAARWTISNLVFAPSSSPTNDFYGITSVLSPSAFFDELASGDEVHLFSFTVGESGEFIDGVRFFDNVNDPTSLDSEMGGGDFTNYYKIGNCESIFNNSSEEFTISNTKDDTYFEIKAFPNPFYDQITIAVPERIESIELMDLKGKLYYSNKINDKENIVIPTSSFESGVYICTMNDQNGVTISRKLVKF